MFSQEGFSEEDLFWKKHYANLKQWFPEHMRFEYFDPITNKIGVHTQRELSVPWYTLIPYLKPRRVIIEGIAAEGDPEALHIACAKARVFKDTTIISPKNDIGMVLYYVCHDRSLQKASTDYISFEYVSVPLSTFKRPLILLVDDGRVYYDERHAPNYLGRTRVDRFLEEIDYPQTSFNEIYRRRRNHGS
ncbi:MAG: hypothetical protein WC916_01775 [Candidatus Woesearchaeota archaeon]